MAVSPMSRGRILHPLSGERTRTPDMSSVLHLLHRHDVTKLDTSRMNQDGNVVTTQCNIRAVQFKNMPCNVWSK